MVVSASCPAYVWVALQSASHLRQRVKEGLGADEAQGCTLNGMQQPSQPCRMQPHTTRSIRFLRANSIWASSLGWAGCKFCIGVYLAPHSAKYGSQARKLARDHTTCQHLAARLEKRCVPLQTLRHFTRRVTKAQQVPSCLFPALPLLHDSRVYTDLGLLTTQQLNTMHMYVACMHGLFANHEIQYTSTIS